MSEVHFVYLNFCGGRGQGAAGSPFFGPDPLCRALDITRLGDGGCRRCGCCCGGMLHDVVAAEEAGCLAKVPKLASECAGSCPSTSCCALAGAGLEVNEEFPHAGSGKNLRSGAWRHCFWPALSPIILPRCWGVAQRARGLVALASPSTWMWIAAPVQYSGMGLAMVTFCWLLLRCVGAVGGADGFHVLVTSAVGIGDCFAVTHRPSSYSLPLDTPAVETG